MNADGSRQAVSKVEVERFRDGAVSQQDDALVVEEPLEIRLGFNVLGLREHKSISITMRTPGFEVELALGFLFTEGIIGSTREVAEVELCGKPAPGKSYRNVVRVELREEVSVNLKKLERHFYTTSSCGVCGKSSIEALRSTSLVASESPFRVSAEVLCALPTKLRAAQEVFTLTGGLHAAALFDENGRIKILFEDIGRHNAVDKLIGHCLQAGIDLSSFGLVVSGRAGFELVQKAAVARIPVFAAVGAPSTLSYELASDIGMTLVGFLKPSSFNIYSHPKRIVQDLTS